MQFIAFVLILAGIVLTESAVVRRNIWEVIPEIIRSPESASEIWARSQGEWVSEKAPKRLPEPDDRGGANGLLSDAQLAPIPWAPGKRLAPAAAASLARLNAAYRDRFKVNISVTDAYRTLAEQERLRRLKPNLAAVPGTSNHGWGTAVDLGGGINRFGTVQHNWMVANAPAYGWTLPTWARKGGGREEPWHWEYGGAK